MKRWLRDNGLTIAMVLLFLGSITGQIFSGWSVENHDRELHRQAAVSLGAYLTGSAFLSALFENWESEFLQMGSYVLLTAYLFHRGSPESKDPDKASKQDADPKRAKITPETPWPVRQGGVARTLYAHSLGIALLTLFVISFTLHWINSAHHANEEALQHGEATKSVFAHVLDAQLWFESFQNWQSEFFSVAVLVVLGIFLRERGSPESKPVTAPNSETGN